MILAIPKSVSVTTSPHGSAGGSERESVCFAWTFEVRRVPVLAGPPPNERMFSGFRCGGRRPFGGARRARCESASGDTDGRPHGNAPLPSSS